MSKKYKTGVVSTSNFYESDAMDTYGNPNASYEYTPTTGDNSTCGYMAWYTPEGTVAGDKFRVNITVEYEGFDTSNTDGSFSIYFQGQRYDNQTETWTWSDGSSSICAALSGLSSVVLSSQKGRYTFDRTFEIAADNVTQYTGQKVGIRSNYSNGVGHIKFYNFKVIPDKYSYNDSIKLREGNDYIATQEFIEN